MPDLVNVDGASFPSTVLASARPVLVDFWSEHCRPCRAMMPMVAALAESYADRLDVVKLDVIAEPDVAQRYAVTSMPQFILFRGGEEVGRVLGTRTRSQFDDFLDPLLT